jgi:hypothetical protein
MLNYSFILVSQSHFATDAQSVNHSVLALSLSGTYNQILVAVKTVEILFVVGPFSLTKGRVYHVTVHRRFLCQAVCIYVCVCVCVCVCVYIFLLFIKFSNFLSFYFLSFFFFFFSFVFWIYCVYVHARPVNPGFVQQIMPNSRIQPNDITENLTATKLEPFVLSMLNLVANIIFTI